MRTDGKSNKRKWNSLKVGKVSNVGSPAQTPALAAIIKSKDSKNSGTEERMGKLFEMKVFKTAAEAAIDEVLGKDHGIKKMDDLAAKMEELLAKAVDLTKEDLELVTTLKGIPEEDRTFFLRLGDDERKAFLGGDAETRKGMKAKAEEALQTKIEEAAKKAAGEEVVDFEGVKIKKSENETAFILAKKMIEKEKELTRKNRMVQLSKKAAEDYPLLKGTDEEKAELMAHVEDLPEGSVKKQLQDLMKSFQEISSKSGLFKESGVSGATSFSQTNDSMMDLIRKEYGLNN